MVVKANLIRKIIKNPDINVLGLCSLLGISYNKFRKIYPDGMSELLTDVATFLKQSEKRNNELVTKVDLIDYRRNVLNQHNVNILRIKGVRLPIFASEKLAEIVGLTIGDGSIWLDRRYPIPVPRHVRFFNNDVNLLNYYIQNTREIFGIKTVIKTRTIDHSKTNSLSNKIQHMRYLEYCNSLHAIILTMLSVPAGAKVLQGFRVPSWIRNGSKEIKRGFIRGLWTCDADIPHVTSKSKNYLGYQMAYTLWKAKKLKNDAELFLNDIRGILRESKIRSTIFISKRHEFIRKDGVKTMELKIVINRNKDVNRYARQIGFIRGSIKFRRLKERLIFG